MTTETFSLSAAGKIHHNYNLVRLIEHAVQRSEGHFASTGAFVVETGAHTGRSPNDKFTVRDATTDNTLWWDNNKAMTPAFISMLLLCRLPRARAKSRKDMLCAGPDGGRRSDRAGTEKHASSREYAWHAAVYPSTCCGARMRRRLAGFAPDVHHRQSAIVSRLIPPASTAARTETVIAVQLCASKIVLIGGSELCWRNQKIGVHLSSTILMPKRGVMPMHCSANVGRTGRIGGFLRAFGHRQDHLVG